MEAPITASYSPATASASGSSAVLLPGPLQSLAAHLLPEGLKPGRVPITIQMRLGKNDAGVFVCVSRGGVD